MKNVSKLEGHSGIAILDASVVINLIASGYIEEILSVAPFQAVIAEVVADETLINPSTGRSAKEQLQLLINKGVIGIKSLDEASYATFFALTGAVAPNDLHDGEAATIAIALAMVGIPVVDDRKAIRILSESYPALTQAHSLDILMLSSVEKALSRQILHQGVYAALKFARMRAPYQYGDWLYDVLGREKFQECLSIPGSLRKKIVESCE